jgi:phosphate starvation-inducible membrane PsiE
MSETKPRPGALAARYLKMTETVVLTLIAVVLVILSVLLLGSSVAALYNSVVTGQIRDSAIEILDSVLLVMMTMEIVYTVTLSLESHTLAAEPFLVVGTIAAIRRMLVITAESTNLEISNPEAFRNTLIELGLLAVTIITLAVSIYVMRRSHILTPPGTSSGVE